MERPAVVPLDGLPERVTIYEVGARDGLQNEAALVPTEVKAELITRLLDAGLPIVEATSFVHPKWVPQLADAAELMSLLGDRGRDLPVLVPNERGLDRALELGCRHIAIFGSATETFAAKNLNSTLDGQFAMFEPTVRRARDAGVDVRAYVSMCFGDPWEGAVPVEQVVAVGKRLFDLGAEPAEHRRHHRRRHGRPRDRAGRRVRRRRARYRPPGDALPRHLRPGAGQHPGRPARAGSPRSTPAPAASAAAPTPRAPPATWPPRTSSGCSPASASSTASTSTPWSRRAPGSPATSAAPARPPSCARCAG